MNIKEIINKKALKKCLTKAEIEFAINGYSCGEILDYQMSALLMAIKINGMTAKETFYLTSAMASSGDIINLKSKDCFVDKHSTGGISDTTTPAVAPICACAGVKMLKLSGRSLGFTGGTADKLESFDGYNVNLQIPQALDLVNKNGACIITSSQNLAPADKKLYALRDLTATVESIPLIASSIMSKKIASGANAIVLDVKYGNGAFMKTKEMAIKLAKLMVKIGHSFGKKMDYIIGNMNQPLGYNIGNKLEMHEAIEALSGKPGPLYDAIVEISAKCIALGLNISVQDATTKVKQIISSGQAIEKFKQMVKDQGGSLKLFKGLGLKPKLQIFATTCGNLTHINCAKLGMLAGDLGGSRKKLNDQIDYNVGIKTFHKLNSKIKKGDLLFEVFAKTKSDATKISEELLSCYKII